jgi:hypothetical protein
MQPADPSRRLSPELRAEVRQIKKYDEEGFLVGCCFARPVLIEDIMALG